MRVAPPVVLSLLVLAGCRSVGNREAVPLVPAELRDLEDRVLRGVTALADSAWPEIRKAAISTLAATGKPMLGLASEKAMTDPDDDVRVAAIAAVGLSGREEAAGVLARIRTSSASPRVRYAALEALYKSKRVQPESLRSAVVDASSRRPEAAEASLGFLCRYPEIPLTLEWGSWAKGGCTVRFLAATALVNRGEFAGFTELRAALHSTQSAERRTLAWVLRHTRVRDRWAEQALKVLLSDTVVDVRLTAAVSAGELGMAGLAGPLAAALVRAKSPQERRACAEALARLGGKAAAAYLAEEALKGDAPVCLAVAEAVEREDGASYREAVSGMLDEVRAACADTEDPVSRAALLRILLACSGQTELNRLERLAFHSLVPAARAAALKGLAVHGDRHTLRRLETLFAARKDLPGKSVARERLLAGEAIVLMVQRLLPRIPEDAPVPE